MKTLPIVWQRCVSNGETCPRRSGTQGELLMAVDRLRQALRPLGIEPQLQMREIDEAAFAAALLSSNEVRIAGRPLEHWLGAQAGRSRCCATRGDAGCRTLELGGQRFEAVPAALIVQAALRAAAKLLAEAPVTTSCCSDRIAEPACCGPAADPCAGGTGACR